MYITSTCEATGGAWKLAQPSYTDRCHRYLLTGDPYGPSTRGKGNDSLADGHWLHRFPKSAAFYLIPRNFLRVQVELISAYLDYLLE